MIEKQSSSITSEKEKQTIRPLKSLKEYFSQLYLIFCLVSMTWALAYNDHDWILIWYTFVIGTSMAFRTISFFRKGLQCFLIEMCYVMTAIFLYIAWTGQDIKIIFPIISGPLAFYTLFYGDAVIFSDLAKSTTFILHSGGGVVIRRLYWHGDPSMIVTLADLTFGSFVDRLFEAWKIYFMWAVPYYIWLFFTDWKLTNMLKYTFGLKADETASTLQKIKYCVLHFLAVTVTIIVGIISMHIWYVNYLIVALQVISGFAQGAAYDFIGHRINFFKLFCKGYLYAKTEIKNKIKNKIKIISNKKND